MEFTSFFQQALGADRQPYDYQRRLAVGDSGSGTTCQSQLINIPTGLGKTAAVVLAWLWNRVQIQNPEWPRRLIYTLPIRALVEQTRDEVDKWLKNLLTNVTNLGIGEQGLKDLQWLSEHSPIILMGGEELDETKRDWDIHPERPAIIIGTQDMLISRALNRGYGMGRARWPMHFGLLNNDCLWVLDETQLMGIGVRTSAQLDGLRRKIGVAAECATWWASATLDQRLLDTPDHREKDETLALGDEDRKNSEVAQRVDAIKRLAPLPLALTADSAKVVEPYIEKFAATVLEKHRPGSVTIVILNRVNRARDLFDELEKAAKKQTLPERVLVHSRFRPMEREQLSAKIKEPGEKIIIATQAIEAGVDISSRTLITELAPWSSLVQRFGRCNRKGEFNGTGGADIFWINLETQDDKAAASLALPYLPEQLATARELMRQAEPSGAAPAALEEIERKRTQEPLSETHILRRKDLIELFDTTPDLAGLDIDVARYIRDGDERDVLVFWREIPEKEKKPDQNIEPLREELVRVPIGDFNNFLKANKTRIWNWNALDGEWQRSDRLAPGQTYLVDHTLGGYSEKLGWTGENSKTPFKTLSVGNQPTRPLPRDGQGLDDESMAKAFLSIEEHTDHVTCACQKIVDALPAVAPWSRALLQSARWHDVGKAHAYFQRFLAKNQDTIPAKFNELFLAKTPRKSKQGHSDDGRPHFRHELASALAWLQAGGCGDAFSQNLVAYLIAAHHGKVRLSVRSMPGEQVPPESSTGQVLFARGIWHGEKLPAEDSNKRLMVDGRAFKAIELNLSCMKMGEQNGNPSWTARTLSLRDDPQLGVFRLAWLETLLRAADAQGSKL
jgi:CRISPR-associated endonuclease/helicase Cas3